MSKQNRVGGAGTRYDKWTANYTSDYRARTLAMRSPMVLGFPGTGLCRKCKERKRLKGGTMKMGGDGHRIFTCADCKK